LLVVCDAFKQHGVTAMATSHQGWILRILFNAILSAKMGAEPYRAFIQGKGPRESEGLRESLRILDELLTHYVNADAGEEGFGWMNAAQAVMNGDAAMYIHGDWAKGYLVQLGANPDTDIGVVAAPGTQELFLYNIDVFSMPRHAPNEMGAKAFLSTIATRTAQAAFNRIKGSSPIRTDVVIEELDSLGRDTMRELLAAKVRLLVRSGDGWDDALGTFAKIRDEEMVYETYVKNAPVVD
jgi:glucose/mannose transport system substrate-binding protein